MVDHCGQGLFHRIAWQNCPVQIITVGVPRYLGIWAERAARRPEAFPLSRKAMLYLFRVRCSANRSGDPIVAEKRPNSYARNYPELQAWIEMAHRPLVEVNDAARR